MPPETSGTIRSPALSSSTCILSCVISRPKDCDSSADRFIRDLPLTAVRLEPRFPFEQGAHHTRQVTRVVATHGIAIDGISHVESHHALFMKMDFEERSNRNVRRQRAFHKDFARNPAAAYVAASRAQAAIGLHRRIPEFRICEVKRDVFRLHRSQPRAIVHSIISAMRGSARLTSWRSVTLRRATVPIVRRRSAESIKETIRSAIASISRYGTTKPQSSSTNSDAHRHSRNKQSASPARPPPGKQGDKDPPEKSARIRQPQHQHALIAYQQVIQRAFGMFRTQSSPIRNFISCGCAEKIPSWTCRS